MGVRDQMQVKYIHTQAIYGWMTNLPFGGGAAAKAKIEQAKWEYTIAQTTMYYLYYQANQEASLGSGCTRGREAPYECEACGSPRAEHPSVSRAPGWRE